MANLVVRKLDDDLVLRLKEQARRHGRSAEAEHRAILEDALRRPVTGEELWSRLRAGVGEGAELDWTTGVDDTIHPAAFD